MSDAQLQVKALSKQFDRNPWRFADWKGLLAGSRTQRREARANWALRDIDLTLHRGDALGLIGLNGTGKTTLLQCMAGIIEPTAGTVVTRCRVAALLELGAGFHPELTGRENAEVQAALYGLSRTEVRQRLPAIIAFADIGQSIDDPVRTYSSGMFLRLGFAIATQVHPELLLIDEIIAVGDEPFRKKCLLWLADFARRNNTLVLATHELEMLCRVCHRAIVLDRGRAVFEGPPEQAVDHYTAMLTARAAATGAT